MAATSLLQLSHELLHCILIEVNPCDLSSLMRSCKDLNNFIRGNGLLHKDIYHRHWDIPSSKQQRDWESEVQDLVKMNKILDSTDPESKEAHLEFIADRVKYLMDTAAIDPDESLNIKLLAEHFDHYANVDAILTSSSLFTYAGTHPHRMGYTSEMQQASAKLHCLYGMPITEYTNRNTALSPAANTRLQSKPYLIHAYARAKVYDLREYTDDTLWGPFMDDGSQNVDWEKVEAILIDLAFNIRRYHERTSGGFPLLWTDAFVGVTPNSFVDPTPQDDIMEMNLDEETVKLRELALKLDELDPYGVTGTWMRVVCFLDYTELSRFNLINSMEPRESRPPIGTEEAIRLIRIKWRVTKIVPPGSYDQDEEDDDERGMDWSNFKGERLPIVHFAGVSRSLHASWDPDANSRIRERGTVRQTPEGEIRWTTFSIFHGEERWRSESVQVGGLRSARGVVGNWFDKDYSEHGPAGPTAFWKDSNSISEDKVRHPLWPYI